MRDNYRVATSLSEECNAKSMVGPCVVVSIVSHGHVAMVQRLMFQLAYLSAGCVVRVVVTHNIPEANLVAPDGGWPFKVQIIINSTPMGFGCNHNKALEGAEEPWVCVLNPDVELIDGRDPFAALLISGKNDTTGCVYPLQFNKAGDIQQSERELPTPWALLRRRVLNQNERYVDWVNGAFMLFPVDRWKFINGFDTRYFMYCEDVDISLRLRLHGWSLVRAPAMVIHEGQHASSRRSMHLLWHIQSLLNLWTSATFWRYLLQRRA